MTDIIRRLEWQINRMTTDGAVEEAAIEEIERNRAAIDELVAALKNVLPEVSVCGLTSQLAMIRELIAKHQTTTEKEQ